MSRSATLQASFVCAFLLAACSTTEFAGDPRPVQAVPRVIHAEVVALDQVLTYNRFGSINPYAMIYALKRDVVASDGGALRPGAVRMTDDKRPRPLVLRGNVGDTLNITFTNLLRPEAPDASRCDVVACSAPYANLRSSELEMAEEEEEAGDTGSVGADVRRNANWPSTRTANIVIPGLPAVQGSDPRCTGLQAIQPGQSVSCSWQLPREGSFLFYSHGAPAGGEGDGGSLTQGLFGVVTVEPAGSRWYRSQVAASSLDAVWTPVALGDGQPGQARSGQLDYGQLDMLQARTDGAYELVHGDINAIVHECALPGIRHCRAGQEDAPSFREFTVVFHDELKTFYADPYTVLETAGQFAGVGDGFAINYGASGMGTALLANRLGIGPSARCAECMYEEFFLQSWANGDPALLEQFEDDPSNVHHSYLNDRVRFRNLHAGKETHVFHLHAHQWESMADDTRGAYLDSQTIGPGQAFAYEIYQGGLRMQGNVAAFQTNGSGNRNRTVGDSIFHCHLYPHFAQGMWALWRVHDVLEDGTRRLPDGQAQAGLSVSLVAPGALPRPGTDPMTGVTGAGTPIPAIVPLPGQALPPLPTYGMDGMPGYPFYIAGQPGHRAPQPPMDFARQTDGSAADAGLPRHVVLAGTRGASQLTAAQIAAMPQGQRGARLVRRALALGDFTMHLESADIRLLAAEGEPLERNAMAFHAGQASHVLLVDGRRVSAGSGAGYPSFFPDRAGVGRFQVNGAKPQSGAPFADPCRLAGSWDPGYNGTTRHYNVAAVQLDVVTNSAGWHDPQARINVLARDVSRHEGLTRGAEPFFFRAYSGECIVFNHSNRTPKDLALDDFQVATPTDTIGQHIHLVKFDVTSSDGSGNGWNYEDGTFAPDAVHERICAANAVGGALDAGGRRLLTTPLSCEEHHPFASFLAANMVQTTVQRWFADPYLTGRPNDRKTRDKTLRTVFTHDHFGPSSIQQHGFYSALLIEPAGSEWYRQDGSPMDDNPADSTAVSSRALIKSADQSDTHPDVREYALAVADFALLYEPRRSPDTRDKGLDALVSGLPAAREVLSQADRQRLRQHREQVRRSAGLPVDPPQLPEAISTDHHNPYVVNYSGAPLPLRIGQQGSNAHHIDCARLLSGESIDLTPRNTPEVSRQRDGVAGDLAWVFSSIQHEDPCTPLLAAYEGERIQVRLVQGAQEVQHTFSVEGAGWSRLPDYGVAGSVTDQEQAQGDNVLGLVGAQEVGISEHFEFMLPAFHGVGGGIQQADYLYHFGSQDAIWNGAWGLMRAYASLQQGLAPLYGGSGMAYLRPGGAGSLAGSNGAALSCPGAPNTAITAVATRIDRLQGPGGLIYRQGKNGPVLRDPDALVLLPAERGLVQRIAMAGTAQESWRVLDDWIASWSAQPGNSVAEIEPYVARVRAGDCVLLDIVNGLRSHAEIASGSVHATLPDAPGDALMPTISSLNVVGNAARTLGSVRPSADISFTLPLVWQDVSLQGNLIGRNQGAGFWATDEERATRKPQIFAMQFYAGRAEVQLRSAMGRPLCNRKAQVGGMACEYEATAVPYAFGALPLKPLGDVIGQVSHGLWGAVVVEPAGSGFHDPQTGERLSPAQEPGLGTHALICLDDVPAGQCPEGRYFREHVLFYQDGLNLHWKSPWQSGASTPVADCLVCDDSYDHGKQGFNYRSEPFWARLRDGGQDVGPRSDLNAARFPATFFMEEHLPIATRPLWARAGEEVRIRVVHPGGRARQRGFVAGGHDYLDMMKGFGSPAAALVAPGKAFTARFQAAHEGCYLYRDQPTHVFAGGAWGSLRVDPAAGGSVTCAAR